MPETSAQLEQRVLRFSHDVEAQLRGQGLALEQRDAAIRAAFRAGSTQVKLAAISGLTRQRIQQICGKDEGR